MNEYGLLTIGYEEIKSFFENQLLSMDFSERSHNEMRNDLKSDGPGKSGELSGDRVFVKQMFAKHVANGGEKPKATHTPVDDIAERDVSSGPGLDLDEPSVTECSGPSLEYRGNPCILFRTKRLLTQNKLIAMHRARDRKELIALKRKIREASELVDQLKKGLHEDS